MSWKPEVFVDGQWAGNAVRFATKEEAEASGRELLSRWWVPSDSRATESEDPVNYRFDFATDRAVSLCSEGGCGLDAVKGGMCEGHNRLMDGGHSPQGIAYND